MNLHANPVERVYNLAGRITSKKEEAAFNGFVDRFIEALAYKQAEWMWSHDDYGLDAYDHLTVNEWEHILLAYGIDPQYAGSLPIGRDYFQKKYREFCNVKMGWI